MTSCLWGGSPRLVAEPMSSSRGRPWPAVSAVGCHAAHDELAEAHAASQTLREQLRSANDKAALLLSYREAAEQEYCGMREQTQRLQVGGRR